MTTFADLNTGTGEAHVLSVALWRPTVTIRVRSTVSIDRLPKRGRCANCQIRRYLYRVTIAAGGGIDQTEARCAACWGIREGESNGQP